MSAIPLNAQPVGGVTPATGVTGGPAPCGCPNVIADEVRYPSGRFILESCHPEPYSEQLPGYAPVGPSSAEAPVESPPAVTGAYCSVYDPLHHLAATPSSEVADEAVKGARVAHHPSGLNLGYGYGQNDLTRPGQTAPWYLSGGAYVQMHPRQNGHNLRAGVRQQRMQQQSIGEKVASTVTNAVTNVRDRLGFRGRGGAPAASVQVGPITIPTSVEDVQQPFKKLLGLSAPVTGGAVNLGPLSIPTTVEEVRQPLKKLASQLGLTAAAAPSAASVQLGPISIPTTGAEWQDSLAGLRRQVTGGQAGPRQADPRFLNRLRGSWGRLGHRLGLAAQASDATGREVVIDVPGSPEIRVRTETPQAQNKTARNATIVGLVLLGLAIALGLAAWINRRTLTQKLEKLRADIQARRRVAPSVE